MPASTWSKKRPLLVTLSGQKGGINDKVTEKIVSRSGYMKKKRKAVARGNHRREQGRHPGDPTTCMTRGGGEGG